MAKFSQVVYHVMYAYFCQSVLRVSVNGIIHTDSLYVTA